VAAAFMPALYSGRTGTGAQRSGLQSNGTRSQAIRYAWSAKGRTMKISVIALAAALVVISSLAIAESGAPSGQGSTTGDPAASSQNANPNTTGMSSSKSGSGTSTSGGSDANGDQGRDKMPDSSVGVRPYDKQNKPPK
jgi:hypothetical protein